MQTVIGERYKWLLNDITKTALECHRQSDTINFMAVSKGQSLGAMKEAFAAGCIHFGENRVQEALQKMNALQTYPLYWHFIGSIQSNKTRIIAEHFDWVHSVTDERIARRLNAARPLNLSPLKLCVEVNLDDEPSKSGVPPASLFPLLQTISTLENLDLKGLMVIPKQQPTEEQQYLSFLRLKTLLRETNNILGLNMKTLSMGMSADYKAAIRAGSTFLRLGRILFDN